MKRMTDTVCASFRSTCQATSSKKERIAWQVERKIRTGVHRWAQETNKPWKVIGHKRTERNATANNLPWLVRFAHLVSINPLCHVSAQRNDHSFLTPMPIVSLVLTDAQGDDRHSGWSSSLFLQKSAQRVKISDRRFQSGKGMRKTANRSATNGPAPSLPFNKPKLLCAHSYFIRFTHIRTK